MRGTFSLLSVFALLALPTRATATTINFEGLSNSEIVTNQFSAQAVMFSNALALTGSGTVDAIPCSDPGGGLNDLDFPPHSGCTVVLDDGGPMRLDFASAVSSFSGFFTYATTVTVDAFDGLNALLGSASSSFAANYTTFPGSPNELVSLSFLGIRSIVITGDPGGASFVLDDVSFTPQADTQPPPNAVPEPGTLCLVGIGAGWLARRKRS